MRRRLWLSATGVAVAAVAVAGIPLLVAVSIHNPRLLGLGLLLLVAAVAVAGLLARLLASRAARPVEELAEAAGRLASRDPRPVGRRDGVTELDPGAAGPGSAAPPVTPRLTAGRQPAD